MVRFSSPSYAASPSRDRPAVALVRHDRRRGGRRHPHEFVVSLCSRCRYRSDHGVDERASLLKMRFLSFRVTELHGADLPGACAHNKATLLKRLPHHGLCRRLARLDSTARKENALRRAHECKLAAAVFDKAIRAGPDGIAFGLAARSEYGSFMPLLHVRSFCVCIGI